MDPSQKNSVSGVDLQSDSDNKYPILQTANLTALWQLLTRQPEVSFSYVLIFFVNLGVDIFRIPIWVVGGTLLYFNQRIRKEGFDIEVMATHQGG